MSDEIRELKGFETLPLRQKVLKPFASLAECAYAEDDFPTSFHFGYFRLGNLISIATFIKENHPEFAAAYSYRLRGMAVDPVFQGQGVGKKLLLYGVEFLKKQDCDFLWFNARIKAFSFYERAGFIPHGPLFELPGIGPHKVMYKNLIPR